jgi:hypothetical protein
LNKKALKILKKLNYLVQIQETSDGFIVYTPERIVGEYLEDKIYQYSLILEPNSGIYITCSSGGESYVNMPKYALVTAIACEIHRLAINLDYSHSLINYIDKDGKDVEKIDFLSKIKLNEAELEKHKRLEHVFYEDMISDFKKDGKGLAKLYGVEDGYCILEKIYRS